MITVRCSKCKGDVTIKREWYEFKRKFVCEHCSNIVIAQGIQKFGKAYWGGANYGTVEVLEGEA